MLLELLFPVRDGRRENSRRLLLIPPAPPNPPPPKRRGRSEVRPLLVLLVLLPLLFPRLDKSRSIDGSKLKKKIGVLRDKLRLSTSVYAYRNFCRN